MPQVKMTEPVVKAICHGMWSVTPYAKCDIRCHYCCTLAQGDSIPSGESVDSIYAQIMRLPAGDTVIFGAFSDAYPSAEAEYQITRKLLLKLAQAGRPIVIVSKGVTIARDLDVLLQFGEAVLVQVSISTMDDEQSLRIEPGAAPTSERLQVLRQLYDSGVRVEVNALPWIPGISDLERLLDAIPDDVTVNVSPLATTSDLDQKRLFKQVFKREEIIERYIGERERIGPHPQLSWVRPAPVGHHDPLNRYKDKLATDSKGQSR